jgi:hypothetical protein
VLLKKVPLLLGHNNVTSTTARRTLHQLDSNGDLKKKGTEFGSG